eukprot:4499573-Pleurochrysis_carterae.AAC.1
MRSESERVRPRARVDLVRNACLARGPTIRGVALPPPAAAADAAAAAAAAASSATATATVTH